MVRKVDNVGSREWRRAAGSGYVKTNIIQPQTEFPNSYFDVCLIIPGGVNRHLLTLHFLISRTRVNLLSIYFCQRTN